MMLLLFSPCSNKLDHVVKNKIDLMIGGFSHSDVPATPGTCVYARNEMQA